MAQEQQLSTANDQASDNNLAPASPMQSASEQEVTYFAKTNFRNKNVKFGIKKDDRRRHMYLIGKTGMGKTTVLENMIIADIRAGNGLSVVDPHGDLVEKVIKFVPTSRVNDVVYFNPSDIDHPIAFNVLENVTDTHKHLVASGLIGVFKKIWADTWGPRLEYILMNSILALMDFPGSTLLGVTRILVDKEYRKKVVIRIKDPVVKSFWVDEYDNYNERFRNEAIAPIQNKVGQFLSSAIIRNIVGQSKSTIEMREIMDTKKILLLNLSKGRIGEDNSALLGAMLITKMQIAAMSRVDIPEEERLDFYLYVDEFQNFATESFANVLSEARKYRLNLTIAHQYIEQLDEKVRSAVFGNVGTIVCFRVGGEDAEFIAKEFDPIFDEFDLLNLTKYDIYLKLMIDGMASSGFSATGLPPVEGETGNIDKIIRVSREHYTKDRQVVEDKIMRWTGMDKVYQETAKENAPEMAEPIMAQPTGKSRFKPVAKKIAYAPTAQNSTAGRPVSPLPPLKQGNKPFTAVNAVSAARPKPAEKLKINLLPDQAEIASQPVKEISLRDLPSRGERVRKIPPTAQQLEPPPAPKAAQTFFRPQTATRARVKPSIPRPAFIASKKPGTGKGNSPTANGPQGVIQSADNRLKAFKADKGRAAPQPLNRGQIIKFDT